ncbi:MAG: nitroreductase [Candidatus Thioglobus sp.]|jgi:nitroreductase|nr:nitroreductase [Candidatus Thioglobus sp.]|tara:strand:+ start:605 stop:1270 length:666 start_codon:yes stop_codon:yes gene_type:complete
MDVKKALAERKSTRDFLDKEVPIEVINEIIEQAKTAPSGVNSQPWQIAVVTGDSKTKLCDKMEEAFRTGKKGAMDYNYYPTEWIGEYKERRKACGKLLYSTLEIKREDKQKQLDQWALNYQAFGAPVVLLFFIDKALEKGSYLDYGMFLQSIMLSAVEHGLATCPQAALGEYPEIVREELCYSQDKVLLCGMAIGYEDKSAIINSIRMPREELDKMVRYYS